MTGMELAASRACGMLLGRAPVNRIGWPPGPWDEEGDYYVLEHAGLMCLISRSDFGNINGYVGVERDSKLHGVDYDAVNVFVYGGLTFSNMNDEYGGRWFFGFDTNHAGDFAPGMTAMVGVGAVFLHATSHYRDLAFVIKEVKRLAEQLAKLQEASK